MKTTLTLILVALGLALGGAAHATGGDSCKPKHGGGYTCDVGGASYNVNNATSAAEAEAWLAAWLSSSANATGGDASASASNGDQTVSINNPRPRRVTGNIGLVVDLGDLGRMKTDNLAKIVETVDGAADKCFAAKVMNESPALFNWRTGKRLHIGC